ncbi:NAD(P)/FAD-dependent oxidoreductase [Fulvivirgaceae bacterium PWU4]|uniref:NAD(P)/FAD-dependent oxidoreductase n=1 Tax=Chryseosolibacter histidini TaxID=2782349 RepID=A0AAP2DIK5_9BACT|nr:NAD(P)/FAD-dependent oxidoreductase [Chryseosolibacter histidini]MBT1697021.1 NAD(P)/FAD-dependent oxidoreductase [Chryseosolibacter histidini]
MFDDTRFDVIIVGGSYSGLAAGMALGRALRKVLIIDSGKPCNRQTPHSHNFLTHDGKAPAEIAALARQQVERYDTVKLIADVATQGVKTAKGFEISTASGQTFSAKKLIFATGVRDIMPDLDGFAECWGISVLHCPYCHGYEVRHKKTAILGNGEYAFEFGTLISNWTDNLTLLTNGPSTLTAEQRARLGKHNIKVIETAIEKLEHRSGHVERVRFQDGTAFSVEAVYARCAFEQHCMIPQALGCDLSDDGYIKIDAFHKTTVEGVFACGDNTTRMRTVANAVGMGTTTGAIVNKEIVFENF